MKYVLTEDSIVKWGITLFRIKALMSFGDVEEGELGGYLEREANLSQEGKSWVFDNASVFDNARVSGDAGIFDNARVSGDAGIFGNARIFSDASVSGDARIFGNAIIFSDAHWLYVGPIGSRDSFTTFFRNRDNQIYVVCGCFSGTLDEFERAVTKTHAGTKHEVSYKLAIELSKAQLDLSEECECGE